MNESTLEALVEGANADIRLILGQLQMIRLSSKRLSYDDVKVHLCSCHGMLCFAMMSRYYCLVLVFAFSCLIIISGSSLCCFAHSVLFPCNITTVSMSLEC